MSQTLISHSSTKFIFLLFFINSAICNTHFYSNKLFFITFFMFFSKINISLYINIVLQYQIKRKLVLNHTVSLTKFNI